MDVGPSDRLAGLAVALSSCETLDEVLTTTARFVMRSLGYRNCVIYLSDPNDSSLLVQRAAWGPKLSSEVSVVNPITLRVGQGIVGSCAAAREPIVIDDTHADERHVSDVGSGRSELTVPIVFRSQVLGVIDSAHPEVGYYSTDDAELVFAIAAVASAQIRATLALEQLATAATIDSLTGIRNRRAFDARLAEVAGLKRVYTVAVIDVDGFKAVNDLHGHEVGDEVLSIIAIQLEVSFRDDASATIARIGGDEFAVITSLTPHQIRPRLTGFVDAIGPSTTHWGRIGASVGYACGSDRSVMSRADDAMLVAKRLGGSRVIDHTAALPEIADLHTQRSWHATTTKLLAEQQFSLAFQEIARLDANGSPPLFEALLRSEDPTIDIGELVASAVRTGLDVEIDRWVLVNVLDVLQIHADIVIAQNWTPRSFEQLGLIEDLATELARRNIDPARLIVEITEHASIDDPEKFADTIQKLRSLGVRVALDDLGAGWTSFRLLEAVDIDIVKLDGSWVQQIHTNPIAREMIATTVRCAKLLNLTVIAEWIEDLNDLHALQTLGVEWGQGYYFGKPRPLPEILASYTTPQTAPQQPAPRTP